MRLLLIAFALLTLPAAADPVVKCVSAGNTAYTEQACVGGKPLLEHAIRYFLSQGVRRFVVSIADHSGLVEAFLRQEHAASPAPAA